MLNWLEIYCYIVLPITISLIWFSVYRFKERGCSDNIGITSTYIGIFGAFIMFMVCSISIVEQDSYWGGEWSHEESKLISMENSNGVSGNFTRGTGTISGNTTCSFALEWPDGIMTIDSADTDNVIFHPNDDGIAKVLVWHSIKYMPRATTKDFKSREYKHTYHIWIPRDKINRYVKFN